MEFDITSFDQLQKFSQMIALQLMPQTILALQGELGSGKTAFSKMLLRELGVTQPVTSPTFTIMNQYSTPDNKTISHLDLYRLKDLKEIEQLGLDELYGQSQLMIIEWPEIATPLLPEDAWWIQFMLDENQKRTAFFRNA